MLNPELLQSFIAVTEMKSFTLAAQRLGLRQSTVSQHIKRLEESLQRHLFARDTHSVAPTPDGGPLLDFARQMLEANERMDRFFFVSELRGHIRFGASEDFVLSGLHEVPAACAAPRLGWSGADRGLSGVLYERFDAGELDVIFVKRRTGDMRGTDRLARTTGLGRPGRYPPDPQLPPPFLYPPPSITRALALTLGRAGRDWRVFALAAA